jgi:membrane protease YdiL (CAAX protease family)
VDFLILIYHFSKFIVKKIAPGKETLLDTTAAKATRIVLTAAAFSAAHLQNQDLFSDSYVIMQLVSTFVGSIGLGILKESKAGLLGSIGAHMAHNFIAISPILWSC